MDKDSVVLITGTRKGIGRHLAEYFTRKGCTVIGCSREKSDFAAENYRHYLLDVSDEKKVKEMFSELSRTVKRLDALINNAGIASMNHFLLTPMETVRKIYETNVFGAFLFCREAAKLMQKRKYGRIVNLSTVAVPLKLKGEAAYASSKAALLSLTQILAQELADMGITVNAVGPSPVETDLIRSVPKEKIQEILDRQAIHRFAAYSDITHAIEFFLSPESGFITGQSLFLGGV